MEPGARLRRKAWRSLIAALMLACVAAPPAWASITEVESPAAGKGPYVPGQAIVRFEPGASSADRREARSEADVDFDSTLGIPRAQVVEVEGSVAAAVRRLERQPEVAYAQPNYRYEALAVPPPDDTFFNDLWGLDDPALPNPGVSALEAWENSRGSGQVIAIVDTGVDLTHPDIAGNLWTNPNPTLGDLHGYDFVSDDGDPDDFNFHGTHVAGTAAATAGNGEGVAGVAPEAEIMAVRVLDGDGSGSTADVAAGIVYAANHGADVINLSLGSAGAGDQVTSDAVDLAAAKNAIVVVAAGNDGVDNDADPHTPCVLPQENLLCVAALRQSGSLASFSNFGARSVDLAAPGTSILSAKTDYGAPLFSDGFEPDLGLWTTEAFNGGVPWGLSSSAASGANSATDSPGGDYGQAPNALTTAESDLFTTDPVDLIGERGCRIHFRTKYEIEPPASNGFLFDGFFAGAITGASPTRADVLSFTGTSPGYPDSFIAEEASVSDLDNRDDVHPIFAILSDEGLEFDGAYVDEVRLFCRDETYIDGIAAGGEYDQPNVGNYVRFQGTSMATPHVSGVVALVRAAAPGATATQVVDAILEGTSPIPNPNPAKPTVTGGIADACQAIAVATGGDVAVDCPGSSRQSTQPPLIPVTPDAVTPNSSVASIRDKKAPDTFISQRPAKVSFTSWRWKSATFRFRSSEGRSQFLCKIDEKPFQRCSRKLTRWFAVGSHVVRVKARDAAGNVDPTPAVYRFRIEHIA
jgi:thermitase